MDVGGQSLIDWMLFVVVEALGSGGAEAGRYVLSGARPRRPRRDGDGDAAEPQSPTASLRVREQASLTHTLTLVL